MFQFPFLISRFLMNKDSDAVPVPFIKLFGKNPRWEKALKIKILDGKFILTSTSGWLWGADIIFPQKLIINQKTLSDCQILLEAISNHF